MPFGTKGVLVGAAQVFFAYLGFDVVASSAAEVKEPAKNMPRGIIGTLAICTLLYIRNKMMIAILMTTTIELIVIEVRKPREST